jgi:gamma-glutamyltranspeptidase/glutathione hydrolase
MRNFERPGRSVVMSTHGMAATSHPLSSLVAVDILKSGGNAMDAAIAACATQCVVEPGSTGIGGDCFALFARPGDPVRGFNGSGRTPVAATAERFASLGMSAIDRHSPHAVTVPGAIDAWATLSRDHGSLPFKDLLRPAITLAREGYAVTPRVSFDWARQVDTLRRDPQAARIFLNEGAAPVAGSVHRQPELAATLEAIGEGGRDAFYLGEVAGDIVERLRSLGGLHTLEDFASAQGEYVAPIKQSYRGHEVYELPPNGQGIVALLILALLDDKPVHGDPLSPDCLQIEIEVARLAYAMRDKLLGDPEFSGMQIEEFLSPRVIDSLKSRLKRCREPAPRTAKTVEHTDTVYIAVVDRDRMAVSFINSLFNFFGSGILAPRSGVLLHNRGQSFRLDPGHPNTIAPRKRPMHTIIPGMVMREGRVEMPFGVMGGHYQAMGHAHVLSKVFDFGLDLQEAFDLPRLFPRPGSDVVEAESSFPLGVLEELGRRGFEIAPVLSPLGGAQAVRIDWASGALHGASDPRKDGCALGY